MEWAWNVLEGAHEEVAALSSLAVPSVLSNMLEGGMGVVDVMMLGYLGKGHLAALSVGNAFFNITWFFIEGFLTAQDTLASNAYGMGDLALVRQWSYISFFSTMLLCAAASVSFLFVQPILGIVFWMPYHLKTKASVHIYLLSPGLWFLGASRVLQKYFQAQNDMLPGLMAGAVANGVNIALNYFFIYYCEFGFAGCGLATSISRLCALLYLCWCVHRSGHWSTILDELQGLGGDPIIARAIRGVGSVARRVGCCEPETLGRAYRMLGVRRNPGNDGHDEDDGDDDEDDGVELISTPGQRKAVAAGGKRGIDLSSLAAKPKPKPKPSSAATATTGGISAKNPLRAKVSSAGFASSSTTELDEGDSGSNSGSDSNSDSGGSSSGSDSNSDSGGSGEESDSAARPASTSTPRKPDSDQESAVARRRRLVLVRVLRFAVLGIPGGLMLGLDSWIFVVMSLFVAQMGTVPLATHEVMAMLSTFVYTALPLALSVAATVRVGHLLAAQRVAQARFSTLLCLAASCVAVAVSAALVYYTPTTLGSVFTDDEDVLYRLKRVAPILAGFQAAYGLQGVLQGPLRAMGKQGSIAAFTLVCVWALGLPAGLYMAFYARPTFGFDGLWGGALLGMGCLGIGLVLLVLTTSWEAEGRKALLRADMPLPVLGQPAAGGSAGGGSSATVKRARVEPVLGLPRPGSLSRGGFPLAMLSLGDELDEAEWLGAGEGAGQSRA